jgi:histidinol-phosphate/aromatic aminotransferase/cobyric acid decarboxylase-like protein
MLTRLQPDWSVNGLAQVAGVFALADLDYLPAARQAVDDSKRYLVGSFQEMGFRPLPSAANYLLVEVGNGSEWQEKLMRRGIFLRDCTSFGLPDCIRVGIRALPDCRRLVEAMKSELRLSKG